MKNNKGLSLIEIIVVLAVMAVLTSLAAISSSLVFGLDARECAKELDACLKMTKTSALSKDAQELRIYQNAADQQYYAEFIEYKLKTGPGGSPVLEAVTIRNEMIGKDTVTITYELSGSSPPPPKPIDTTHSITIGYNRSTGAFEHLKENGVTISKYCKKITISRAAKSYRLELIPETGKHFISN